MARLPGRHYGQVYLILVAVMIPALVAAACAGAVDISVHEIGTAFYSFFSGGVLNLNERIFMFIRLPRVVMCIIAGSGLAVGGTLMQTLFRNPIVEPGLVGTSSGAAFGASVYLVLGAAMKVNAPVWGMPVCAFLGGSLATGLVLVLAPGRRSSFSPVAALLVTGIAINALFLGGVGFMTYIARDPQARSITFWNLGTLAGSGWQADLVAGLVTVVCMILVLPKARALNTLVMGDEEAGLMGTNVKRLRLTVLLLNVLMVSAITSFCGVIGFVGLIVPHLMRTWKGNDTRYLLLSSALAGSVLLLLADIVARLLLSPAELPIGIVTSWVGVVVFVYLLRTRNFSF